MKTKNASWVALVIFLAVPVYGEDFPSSAPTVAASGPMAQVPSAQVPLPPVLSPGAAEVVKLSAAGLSEEVILAYVKNCQSSFNLSADAILRLKEAGISSPVIVTMLTHDSSLRSQNPPNAYDNSQQPMEPMVPDVAPEGQTPPPVPEEVIPVAPGPDYYWTPGYWGWNDGWIWIGGSWGFRGGYGWGGHYGRGWYGRGGWGGYHGGVGAFHGGSSVFHVGGGGSGTFHGSGGGFHGGGGSFHGGGGGHGGGHGR